MPYDPEPDWFGGSATAQAEAEPDWFGAVAEPVAQAPAPIEAPAAWETPIAAATDADIPQPEGGPARMPQATLDQWGAEIDQLPLGPERDELASQYAEAVQQNSQAGFDTRQGAARGLTYEQQLASQGDSFGAAWAEATPVIPKNLALGVASVGKTIGNIASTLTGNREKADKVNRIWQFGQGLSTAGDRESFMAEHSAPLVAETVGQLSQFIGQAAASNAVAKTAGLGAKGAYALMAAMYGTSTADDSYTHGVDAGLSPVKATAYAGGMGALEAGLMMLGGKLAAKLGLKTAEELLTPGIKRAAERTVGKYLKDAVLSTFIEGGEEGVTQASQQLWGTALGADSTDGLTQNTLRAAMLGAFGNVAASGIDAALTDWPTVVEATKAAEAFEGSPPPDTRRGFEKATGQKNTSKVYREAFIDEVGRKNAELTESAEPLTEDAPPQENFVSPLTEEMLAPIVAGADAELEQWKAGQPAATDGNWTAAIDEAKSATAQVPAQEFNGNVLDVVAPYAKTINDVATKHGVDAKELSRRLSGNTSTVNEPDAGPSVAYSGLPLNLTFDVSSIGKAGRRVGKTGKRLLREYFTSAGLANEDISRLNDQRLGKISKHAMQLQQLQSDLNAALNNEFGVVKTLSPELRAKVDAALKGEATDLPASVVRAVEPMRKQVDALSQQFIEAGIGNEDLQATIEENKGVYLTRTYHKHQDKNWAETAKDNPQLMADTKAALKAEYPDDSDSDIEWRINTLLDKDSVDAKGAPDRFKKDAKFQSILMERKNLPEWVRNLYGENRDPWINHTLTVTKMAQLLAHHEFMSDVKDAGMAASFLSDASEKNPANYRRIDSTANRLLEPLNGMFTDPDTHKALNDLFSAKSVSPFYRAMTGLSMLTKWNLTVGSFPKGYIRNFLGNPAFALSNGDIGNGDFKKAIKLTRDHIFNMGDDASRQYMQRLAELGILDSEVGLSELKAMMGDLADAGDTPQLTPGVLKRGASRVMGAFSKVYQAMDATWKINGFESKKKYYAELNPEASAAEVEQMAADDIKKHYPTYSQVPKGVKLINRTPLYGNFLSFNAEVIRTLKNNLVTINEELRSDNPTANKMGKRRAAGLVASLAMYPTISTASRLMFGVTDDEDDDLRRFQAPWTRNSPFLYTGPLKDGKADTMDLGFMDPRALFTKTVYALMGPGTTKEKIEQAFTEITNPLDEDILYGRIISVLRNRTADGRQVYNDSASSEEKMRKSADYLGQVLLPATWSQLERIRKGLNGEISPSGRMYDAATEAVGLVGFRAATVDVRTSLTYRSNDLRRTISDAESGMRQQLLHRGTVPIEETKRVLMDFAQQREKYLQQWHELAQAAIRLGVPENEVRIAVKGATASKKLTQMVMSGEIQPYAPSTETMQEALSRPGGRERADAMRGLLPAPVASPVQ